MPRFGPNDVFSPTENRFFPINVFAFDFKSYTRGSDKNLEEAD